MPAPSQASLLLSSCAVELDSAVTLYNNGDALSSKAGFEKLEQHCAHLPQVHHNLGVLAGEQKDWQQAELYFRKAMLDDTRTSMTLSHLQSIHQYQATLAYQTALNLKKSIEQPQFQMQDSTLTNATFETAPKTSLHNVSTVDYELYAWWNAAAENAAPDWLEHYIQGYPPLENTDAKQISWSNVTRDITFTAQDAVVVLSYQKSNINKKILLLLRLQNNRWKIYREAQL